MKIVRERERVKEIEIRLVWLEKEGKCIEKLSPFIDNELFFRVLKINIQSYLLYLFDNKCLQ